MFSAVSVTQRSSFFSCFQLLVLFSSDTLRGINTNKLLRIKRPFLIVCDRNHLKGPSAEKHPCFYLITLTVEPQNDPERDGFTAASTRKKHVIKTLLVHFYLSLSDKRLPTKQIHSRELLPLLVFCSGFHSELPQLSFFLFSVVNSTMFFQFHLFST